MGLAKAGRRVIIEKISALLAAKNHFVFLFFVILKKRKWFLLGSGLVGISVFLIPAFAKPFPVMHNATSNRKTINQLTKSTNLTKKITKFEANNRYRKL